MSNIGIVYVLCIFFPKAVDLPQPIWLPKQTETDLHVRVENAESSYRAGRQREGGFLVLVTYLNVDASFLQGRKQQMPHRLDEFIFLSLILTTWSFSWVLDGALVSRWRGPWQLFLLSESRRGDGLVVISLSPISTYHFCKNVQWENQSLKQHSIS